MDKVAWSVRAVAGRMPGATCLVQALALQRLLSRAGHVSALEVGVAKSGRRLEAHAWLRYEGSVLIGGSAEPYTPLVAWKSEIEGI